jgi:hypothetical protein
MKATATFFWVVTALFLAQVLLGIVTAHYAIEGQGLYGLPLAEYLPYSVTRTWHTQLAVLMRGSCTNPSRANSPHLLTKPEIAAYSWLHDVPSVQMLMAPAS